MGKNDNVVFGSLKPPEEYTGQIPETADEKVDRDYFGRIRLCDSLFLFMMMPGMVDRIFFVGKKNKYVQDYSGIKPVGRKKFLLLRLKGLKQMSILYMWRAKA